MKWISSEELAIIHDQVIVDTGGITGVTNAGGLESALQRPFTKYGGVELFPGLLSKVAALIHSIIAFHPFADGNKRTALVTADVCLRLNGHRLTPSEDLEPFFWSVARGEREIEEIADWLRAHVGPFQEPFTSAD